MKVLYFGHYKEGTGWAQAAIDYILALDSVGVDVVCRNINLTGVEHQVPKKNPRIREQVYRRSRVLYTAFITSPSGRDGIF
tara:strand:+ start:502 stop:744 length:243 start_codon:yes stop_codon:yes gene_type:complete